MITDRPLGVWLFHCHIEWHVVSGLVATFVEAPLDLQKTIDIPKDHLDVCSAGGVPTVGNTAANDKDFMDLSGQNKPPGSSTSRVSLLQLTRIPRCLTSY